MQRLNTRLLLLSLFWVICGLSSCSNDPKDEPDNPNEETNFMPTDASISYFANGVNVTFDQIDLSIGFYSNKKWSASIAYTSDSKDWIVLSEQGGKAGDNSFTISISENMENKNRTAVITIAVGGNNEYINILQSSCTNGDIDVMTPGSLSDFLPEDARPFITELKVRGKLNGRDIKLIRSLFRNNGSPQLQKLDLANATIVSGGEKYLDGFDAVADCHTSDFAVSPFMFMDFQGTELIIPQNTRSVGLMSFFGLPNVESILLPDDVEFIDWQVFVNCSSLKELTIPANVKPLNSIMGLRISDCSQLECLRILSESINISVSLCDNLQKIILHGGINDNGITSLPNLTEIELSEGITEIGMFNFKECPLLKTITIPSSVNKISSNALVHYNPATQKVETYFTEIHYRGTSSPWGYSMPDGFSECILYVPETALSNFSNISAAFKRIIGE